MIDRFSAGILRDALEYISEEMAVALKRSAFSPNIRERADHSCAVLDRRGRTIGQAEQIPVHIGSLPYGLAKTLQYLEDKGVRMKEKEMYVVNDPYISGTHLNDVTVIRPFFWRGELVAFLANKAHHVDVGGIGIASISPKAKNLSEEGMIIEPTKLLERDKPIAEVMRFMKSGSRRPDYIEGDLHAQINANLLGERRMTEVLQKYGSGFESLVDWILLDTKKAAEAEYQKLPHGRWRGEDYLEFKNGLLTIRAEVEITDRGVWTNFEGTSKQVRAPYNAVLGVTKSAVTFAIKTLLSSEVALNDGFNRTIHVEAPLGCLVNPRKPAPVAAGNLETSQRIVDVIYKALSTVIPNRIPAASHGSMNNLMMGGKSWTFYETIGGGYGGRYGMDGVDGIQVNMTNTMNTPIEVMEHYYPIIFTSYRLRKGSGGSGRWRGGGGIERSFKALEEFEVSIIGDRSVISPWGMRRGRSGRTSEYLLKSGRRTKKLMSKDTVHLRPGDELIVRTAGAGGYFPKVGR
jgi:N-methylhydantoinase B